MFLEHRGDFEMEKKNNNIRGRGNIYLIWIYLNIPLCVVQKDLLAFLLPGKGPAI